MLDEAFWDKEKAELVSLGVYPLHDVGKGEVLFDRHRYVSARATSLFTNTASYF